MTKTGAILVAMLLGGCGLYSGDDDSIEPIGMDGAWIVSADISPCVFSARVLVDFEIEGSDVSVRDGVVGGLPVEQAEFIAADSTVHLMTRTGTGGDVEWFIELADADGVASATVWFYDYDGGCSVEERPANAERM